MKNLRNNTCLGRKRKHKIRIFIWKNNRTMIKMFCYRKKVKMSKTRKKKQIYLKRNKTSFKLTCRKTLNRFKTFPKTYISYFQTWTVHFKLKPWKLTLKRSNSSKWKVWWKASRNRVKCLTDWQLLLLFQMI